MPGPASNDPPCQTVWLGGAGWRTGGQEELGKLQSTTAAGATVHLPTIDSSWTCARCGVQGWILREEKLNFHFFKEAKGA